MKISNVLQELLPLIIPCYRRCCPDRAFGTVPAIGLWHTVDYVDGIKVLAPKDPEASMNLPERSNTPGTSYLIYRKNGDFDQLRVFGENRMPQFDIDYGIHDGEKSLHVHYYTDGVRGKHPDILHPGDALYEKYKRLFNGVK